MIATHCLENKLGIIYRLRSKASVSKRNAEGIVLMIHGYPVMCGSNSPSSARKL
jgi:hypothetical protein